jgi:RHS repeat-associated protein
VTYAYDSSGQRVKLNNGTATTLYPTKEYNTDGTTAQKHIFAGSETLATVKGTGTTASVFYDHTDHLSGSSVITNSSGDQEELLDYYPFGGMRLDEKVGTFNEQRKYIGQEYDEDTGLNYLNARYYNSSIGRFISQDPVFWTIPVELLTDPQQLNSYTYARNNPIIGSDPSGLYTIIIPGTWYKSDGWENSKDGRAFQSAVKSTFNETRKTDVITNKGDWSGGDNPGARSGAAVNIASRTKYSRP